MDIQTASKACPKQSQIGFRKWLGGFVLILFFSTVLFFHWKFDIGQYLTKENIGPTISTIRTKTANLGAWGLLLFTAAGSLAFMLTIPALLIIYLSVILFGYFVGGIVSTLALLGGTTLIYLTGQALGKPFVHGLFGKRLARVERRFSRRELMNVVYLRLLFFMSPWMNWLLCVTGVKYHNVLLGTVLGTAHNIILNIWLGGLIIDLIQSGQSLNPIKTPKLLIPLIIGLVIFVVVRLVDSTVQRRRYLA